MGGQELCSGVAALIIDRAKMLKNGNSAGAFADLNDVSIVVKSINTTAPVEPCICPSGYSGLIATSDCKGYYLCLNGALASENPTYCPDGLLYNNDLQVCDLETNVVCEPPPTTPMPTIAPTVAPTFPPVSPSTAPSEVQPDTCPFGYSGLIATSDCSGFYHCLDGSLIYVNPTYCQTGLLFR